MNRKETSTRTNEDRERAARWLAAFGAQLDRWPDAACAAEARRLLMADRPFRAAWEAERDLDRGLSALRAELDEAVARDGAAGRVSAASMARLPRPLEGINWRSLAAAMILAALLGGALQALRPPAYADPVGPALLDPTLPEIEELR
jgi:hypothetical protein